MRTRGAKFPGQFCNSLDKEINWENEIKFTLDEVVEINFFNPLHPSVMTRL